jgi:PilZ domain
MGSRSEPRKQIEVPVRIFGTDARGQMFSEKVATVDISHRGAQLAGVHAELRPEEIVGLTYANNKVHFRVKWVGAAETPMAGRVGLLNTAPEKPLWDFPLPTTDAVDVFQPGSVERRRAVRFRCQNSVEVHLDQGPSFWGTVADLSVGGCYVEMPLPLQPGTTLKVGIWFGESKAWAQAQVAHRTPGLGVGLRFTEISDQDLTQIRRFLENLAPFAKKPMRSVGMHVSKT